MKIYDISQEVFSCCVFPGNRSPKAIADKRIADGLACNLSSFEMCAHNGTHVDAPTHFIEDGKTIDQIGLEKLVGWCYVTEFDGELSAQKAIEILKIAKTLGDGADKKILFKGQTIVTAESAEVFAEHGIDLIGVESQSVGAETAPMKVHKILLSKDVVLLEGVRLSEVEEGVYFLHSAPINLGGLEGAPARATLLQF